MTYERAKAILDTAKANARSIKVYKDKIAKCQARIEAHQKLTASYGTERVKGGRGHNIIEDAVVRAEQNLTFYQAKLEQLMIVRSRADILIHAMPKKWWKVARLYYLKGASNRKILSKKGWTSRTSIYKQIKALDDFMKEYFKE